MRQMVAWCVVAGLHLTCAACSNDSGPGTMIPGVGVTAGTGMLPGAAGSFGTPTAGTAAAPPVNPVPTGAAGSGMSGPVTGAAGMAPVTGAAGSTPMTGAAGSPMPPVAGTMGSSAAGAPATSGTGGADGMAMTAGTGGGAAEPAGFMPKCLTKGAELTLIGDSWINYPLGEYLAPYLERRARMDGALAQTDRYNDQAVAGSSLASGGIAPLIPTTWEPAKSAATRAGASAVKFVVMDGGGNDVLLGNAACLENGRGKAMDPSCQKTVQDATNAGRMLRQKMIADGVSQAIYFFYPHVPAGGWDMIDYALPMAKEVCEGMNSPTTQCYFVDTRDAFQGPGNTGVAMANLIGIDGIHPSATGMNVLADLIWKTMKEKCMAQGMSSGCCMP